MSTNQNNFADLLKAIDDAGEDAQNLAKQPEQKPEDKGGADGKADADDKTIQDASKDSNDGKTDPDLAKSMTVTGADGKPLEVVDATDLIKSLQEQVAGHDDLLAKALGSIGGAMKQQGDLIKAMSARIDQLASQGRGRMAVISAVEKPAVGEHLQKSQDAGEGKLTVGDFLIKSNEAYDAGKITGAELRAIDVAARYGSPIEPALISKVQRATA